MSNPLLQAFIQAQIDAAKAAAQAAIAAALASNPAASTAALAQAATTAATDELADEVSTLREEREAYLAEALALRARVTELEVKLAEGIPSWVANPALPPVSNTPTGDIQ